MAIPNETKRTIMCSSVTKIIHERIRVVERHRYTRVEPIRALWRNSPDTSGGKGFDNLSSKLQYLFDESKRLGTAAYRITCRYNVTDCFSSKLRARWIENESEGPETIEDRDERRIARQARNGETKRNEISMLRQFFFFLIVPCALSVPLTHFRALQCLDRTDSQRTNSARCKYTITRERILLERVVKLHTTRGQCVCRRRKQLVIR